MNINKFKRFLFSKNRYSYLLERVEHIFNKYRNKFPDTVLSPGTLYIVSTPIGNLEDFSFRAVNTLAKSDLIACEDTRVTNYLLKEFDINTKTVSYHSYSEKSKLDYFINELKSGKIVSLVSDAGTPCISDPGNILVSECIKENIEVRSVPGCSSLIHALVQSGFSLKKFYFQGFLPQKKNRQTVLKNLTEIKMPIVIFESPFRVLKLLSEIYGVFGNKEISVSRELTKKFEQTVRGNVKSFLNMNLKQKGEFVIVINNI